MSGWGIYLDYCGIEWFSLEMNRDHSVIFEVAVRYCISDSFIDYEGYSISSRVFLTTVVNIMVIWTKFTHSCPLLIHWCQRCWSWPVPTRLSRTNVKNNVLFIIGDWNAKVGSQEIPGVTGKFGLGVQHKAWKRLTEFCHENTLVIANTLFQQNKRWLYTWTSPNGQ